MRARVLPFPPGPVAAPAVGECHVWLFDLDRPPLAADRLAAALTPDEAARAARYRIGTVRDQFTLARGALRTLLGAYLDIEPGRVPIVIGPGGKPLLAGGDFHFNVTHTPGLAVLAAARVPVGVDAEKRRAIPDADGLVRRFFSAAEREAYHALAPAARPDAFYRGWVCKEAVIKAAGATMHALDGFDVELDPARPARVIAARHEQVGRCPWAVADWAPAPGYAAAVAVEGEAVELVRA